MSATIPERLAEAQRLCDAGQNDRAEALARGVLAEAPGDVIARFVLARSLAGQGRLLETIEHTRPLLDQFPGHPAVAALQYNAMMGLGDADGSWQDLAAATRMLPNNPDLLSNLAGATCWASQPSPDDVFAWHAAYGRAVEAARPGEGLTGVPDPDPERKLRLGIISGDFWRLSSVAFFIKPVFEHLDRSRFEIAGYHTSAHSLEGTDWFRERSAAWRHMPQPDPDALASQIRADRIDIALELNIHTGLRRTMPAFQPRCAPLQITYLGYACTTGMRSFDWRIVDNITDPAPAADRLSSERLWRMDPCFICFAPSPLSPEPAPGAPFERTGHVTFGAFNEPLKLNDGVFRTWARVLAEVPGSRFLLKNRSAKTPDALRHTQARMAAAGVDLSRVEMIPRIDSYADHLRVYDRVDLALDSFPYNGTTTVCEALLMGVPVVACEPLPQHDRHAARVAISLLRNVGLEELVAHSPDGLVATAVSLAQDRPRLAALRSGIRERFLSSVVCDQPGFCRRLEGVLRSMWRERCARV